MVSNDSHRAVVVLHGEVAVWSWSCVSMNGRKEGAFSAVQPGSYHAKLSYENCLLLDCM
jgi:hypothetical protein